jgi:hypothetical protein
MAEIAALKPGPKKADKPAVKGIFLPDGDFCRAVAGEVAKVMGVPVERVLGVYSPKDRDADACYRARHALVAVAYAQKQGNLVEPALGGLMKRNGLTLAEMQREATRMRSDAAFNLSTTKVLHRMREHPVYGYAMSMTW